MDVFTQVPCETVVVAGLRHIFRGWKLDKFVPSHAKDIDTPTSSDALGVGQLGLSYEAGLRMSDLPPSPLVAGDAFRTACLALAESYRRVGVEARWTPTSVRLPTSFFNVRTMDISWSGTRPLLTTMTIRENYEQTIIFSFQRHGNFLCCTLQRCGRIRWNHLQ